MLLHYIVLIAKSIILFFTKIITVPRVIISFSALSLSINLFCVLYLVFEFELDCFKDGFFRSLVLWGPLYTFLFIFTIFFLLRQWEPKHKWAKPLVFTLTVISLLVAIFWSFVLYLVAHLPT